MTSLAYIATIHVPLLHSVDAWNTKLLNHHQPSLAVGHGEEGHWPALHGEEEELEGGFPLHDDGGIPLPCDDDEEGISLTLAQDEDSGDPLELCEEEECDDLQESPVPMATDRLLEVTSEQVANLSLKGGSGAQATQESSSVQAKSEGSGAQVTCENTGVAREVGGTWADGYFQVVNFTYVVSSSMWRLAASHT